MALLREVPDFAAIARASLCRALSLEPQAACTSQPLPTSSRAAFFDSLAAGASLRRSAALAGLDRPRAKELLRRLALTVAAFEPARVSDSGRFRERRVAAWAFAAKPHAVKPPPLDQTDPHTVWTHVWVDAPGGIIARWIVGPHPSHLVADSPAPGDTRQIVDVWRRTLPPGLLKKVDLHAHATAFFVIHHNFCRVDALGRTPAMRSAISDRAWTADDLGQFVAGMRTEGAA